MSPRKKDNMIDSINAMVRDTVKPPEWLSDVTPLPVSIQNLTNVMQEISNRLYDINDTLKGIKTAVNLID